MEGKKLGPYAIDRELGAGGMGKVYAAVVEGRAMGLRAGTRVALKVVHPHLLATEGFFMRFMREASLGASIQHENVVRTYLCDQLVVDGTPNAFLVMEYVEGQNLRDLLRELERVPEEMCRHIGREIARGLDAIHGANVVHRDLKPENVLITAEHAVKVMDLGVARLADEQMRLSQSGAFVGSVEYAAPEQFGGAPVDHRCDLHALGVLLYELSCGKHPYRGDDFRDVMKRVCNEAPRRLGEIHPQLSPFFEELVHTLLAKECDERIATADEVVSILEEGEDSPWWHERAAAMRSRTRRPLRRVRIPRETAVHGREAELERLSGLYAQAKAGGGQVVVLEGEAGIGKSRIVDELAARLQAGGEDLNFLFSSYPPGGAATASGAFSAAYREHFGGEGSADYLAETPSLVPAFDALLKGESAPSGADPLTKDSLQTCFVNVTRALAAERPTVVLIDDLHFAPDEGRALFSSLAMAAPEHRILLVGTTRPGVSDEWLAGLTRLAQTSHIELSRLEPKDIVGLLEDAFASKALAESLGLQIVLKSDGNPFFAFEIIRGLREGQFISQAADGTWVSTQVIDEIQIPSSVLDLVNARVADLTEDERDLLDVASCWGFEFDPGLVAAALDCPLLPTLKRFGQIERQHRLVRASGRRYAFDHHQVQEALYGSIFEQVREVYHAALATALEAREKAAEGEAEDLDGALCVDLCDHFLKGAQGERALRYFDAACAHLKKGYLHAEAAALRRRALDVSGLVVGSARLHASIDLARLSQKLGRMQDAEAAALEALGLAAAEDDPGLVTRARVTAGNMCWYVGRNDDAIVHYQAALDAGTALPDPDEDPGVRSAHYGLAMIEYGRGEFERARRSFEGLAEWARETDEKRGEASASNWAANCHEALGRYEEAMTAYERSLELAREAGDRATETFATANVSLCLLRAGRFADALPHAQRACELGRRAADRTAWVGAASMLNSILDRLGQTEDVAAGASQLRALACEIGSARYEAVALVTQAGLASNAGDSETEETLLREALAIAERGNVGYLVPALHAELGLVALEAGRDEPAAAAFRTALESAEPQSATAVTAAALSGLAAVDAECVGRARAALAKLPTHSLHDSRLQAHLLLWRATSEPDDLRAAKRVLDEVIALNPPEYHDAMRENVRLRRELLAAYRDEFGGDDDEDDEDEPGGTESITRAG